MCTGTGRSFRLAEAIHLLVQDFYCGMTDLYQVLQAHGKKVLTISLLEYKDAAHMYCHNLS